MIEKVTDIQTRLEYINSIRRFAIPTIMKDARPPLQKVGGLAAANLSLQVRGFDRVAWVP